jgi:hypothetical protein
MEVKFIWIQVEYLKDGKFQRHGLTYGLGYSKCFLIAYRRCRRLKTWIRWHTLKFDWEYVISILFFLKELLWPTLQAFTKNEDQCLIYCIMFIGVYCASSFKMMILGPIVGFIGVNGIFGLLGGNTLMEPIDYMGVCWSLTIETCTFGGEGCIGHLNKGVQPNCNEPQMPP